MDLVFLDTDCWRDAWPESARVRSLEVRRAHAKGKQQEPLQPEHPQPEHSVSEPPEPENVLNRAIPLGGRPVTRQDREDHERAVNAWFDNLEDYDLLSPATHAFNCFAWAFGNADSWCCPEDSSFPTFEGFITKRLKGTLLYERPSEDEFLPMQEDRFKYEKGYVKVAVFVKDDDDVSHMSRQLPDGSWISKLGGLGVIRHPLGELEGDCYGKVRAVYKIPENEWAKAADLVEYGDWDPIYDEGKFDEIAEGLKDYE